MDGGKSGARDDWNIPGLAIMKFLVADNAYQMLNANQVAVSGSAGTVIGTLGNGQHLCNVPEWRLFREELAAAVVCKLIT
jgi:hypothetical protein